MVKNLKILFFMLVMVFVVSCGCSSNVNSQVKGNKYVLVELNGEPMSDNLITLEFDDIGLFLGSTGISEYSGRYEIFGKGELVLFINDPGGNLNRGTQAQIELETRYISSFAICNVINISGDTLILSDSDKRTKLKYKKQ